MNKRAPKYPLLFFRWFCNPDYVEDIEGDLLERFEKRTNEKKPSRWLFTLDVLRLLRPGIIRPFEGTKKLNYYGMFKNNLRIAWRSALRQKQFTVLNLTGLTLGIATCMAISLYIHDELSYDTFHEKGDRIYRVNQPNIWGDWDEKSSSTGPNVADALRTEAPEFEQVTRILTQGAQTTSPGKQEIRKSTFMEQDFFAAEENFFEVFSFEFLAGDRETVLSNPYAMVLTEETARRYFDEDLSPDELIGQTVEVKGWDGKWEMFNVGGIVKDIPNRSHIQFDILVSLTSYQEAMDMHGWKWIWTAFSTYALVHPGVDIEALENKIQALPPKYAAPTTERIFNQTFEEFTAGHKWKLELQPLEEIYIAASPDGHNFGPSGNPLFVRIFGAIGLLVLALSAINFMNLSTARSSNRTKEIGVRKVMGSARGALFSQFIIESTFFVLLATVLALFSVELSLGWFNALTDKEMELLPLLLQPMTGVILICFVVLLGFASGSYPAFYLSSFAPIGALKGKVSNGLNGKKLRNALVVFQFTISIALIICSSFVQKQLTYASDVDLGFNKNHILQIHNIEQFGFDTKVLKSKLETNPAFLQVGKSFGIPPEIWSGDRYKATKGDGQVVQFNNIRTEEDYLDLLGVRFLAGRNFDPSHPTDKYKIVINEAATKALGWGDRSMYGDDSPIGKKISIASGSEDVFEVIGVVEDFNFNSLRVAIAPLIIIHHENDKVWDYGAGRSFYSMRLDPERVSNQKALLEVIEEVENQLAEIDPAIPFEFSFMDQEFENTFRSEKKMSSVLNIFTLMALVIGCLGLFGLAAFSAEQRTKELSIRKVLGARISSLVVLFSAEFAKLIVISVAIAAPLAWFLVDYWLSNFAYRTPIDFWVFIASAIGALAVAVGTISYQSIQVTGKNPAETLKDE